jgi:hypothetical protein
LPLVYLILIFFSKMLKENEVEPSEPFECLQVSYLLNCKRAKNYICTYRYGI